MFNTMVQKAKLANCDPIKAFSSAKVARHSITSLAGAGPRSLHSVGNEPFKEPIHEGNAGCSSLQ